MNKIRRFLQCRKCGNRRFTFKLEYEKEDEMDLYLCHDGYGFRMEDAEITCMGCMQNMTFEDLEWREDEMHKDNLQEVF